MNDLLSLRHFLVGHDNVLVYGNLSRYPDTLFETLNSDDQLNVVIRSRHYPCPSSPDNRIRVSDDHVDACDMFVLLEPDYDELVEKPPLATRWVIFTSHVTFRGRPETVWTRVCYFHANDVASLARNTQHLLKLQKPSQETKNIYRVQSDAVHRTIVRGASEKALASPTFVVVDLTTYFDNLKMSLALWDAFDYMLSHKEHVRGWVICFPSSGRRSFEQFIQICMDRLFCVTFEYGNVTTLKRIVTLIPYYTLGYIDETYTVSERYIYHIPYIVPTEPIEVCKAATRHNLQHWAKNVYRIKK